jgi:hypothetical protein
MNKYGPASAPRVTLAGLEDKIKAETYLVHKVLTICVLEMANGFLVTGESACASPENYDQVLGQKLAKEAALKRAWSLEGYLLREELYAQEAGQGRATFGYSR